MYLITENHTVAVIKGQESYEILKCSCSVLFKSINKIIRDGKINVDGQDILVDIHIDDYKVYNIDNNSATWLGIQYMKFYNLISL
jgi:hypothetical protein